MAKEVSRIEEHETGAEEEPVSPIQAADIPLLRIERVVKNVKA